MVNYLCDGAYDRKSDSGIIYNDPDIDINWPIDDIKKAIIGTRDKGLMSFSSFKDNCQFIY